VVKLWLNVLQLDPLIAFSLKSFGRLRTAPDGDTMRTTRLTVVKRYRSLKLDNQIMKKITLMKEKSNHLFVWKRVKFLEVSFIVPSWVVNSIFSCQNSDQPYLKIFAASH
jgi:hypothetical protein